MKHWMLSALWIGLRVVPVQAETPSEEASPPGTSAPSVAPEVAAPVPAEIMAPVPARAGADDAGPPTLFSSVNHVGGYGGPSVMYSRIAGKDGVLVGGEGAVFLDHRLALGGAGYGWTRDTRGPADVDAVPRDLEVGYGGFLVRYSILTGTLVYGSIGALVGGGAVALRRDAAEDDDVIEERRADAADAFFVFEPQLSVQVNLLRWMRIGFQGGYRITSGLGRLGYTEAELNGITLGGTLQFGRL